MCIVGLWECRDSISLWSRVQYKEGQLSLRQRSGMLTVHRERFRSLNSRSFPIMQPFVRAGTDHLILFTFPEEVGVGVSHRCCHSGSSYCCE